MNAYIRYLKRFPENIKKRKIYYRISIMVCDYFGMWLQVRTTNVY